MQMFKSLSLIGLFFFSSFVCADGSIPAGDINTIYFYEGHTGVLIKHTNLADPDKCGRQDYFILPDTHSHFKETYALILAAQLAGKKVSFLVSGCYQGIPAIRNVALDKQ